MAANGQLITVAATPTLIYSVVDGPTYLANGYTAGANPNIFKAGDENTPLPLLLVFSSTNTIYLGGSGVTASGAGIGALMTGVTSVAYNCVGGDSLYGIVASSTQPIQLLALRQ
jgi:hypothetical protein